MKPTTVLPLVLTRGLIMGRHTVRLSGRLLSTMARTALWAAVVVPVVLSLPGSGDDGRAAAAAGPGFAWVVDPAVTPNQSSVPARPGGTPRRVAAVIDPGGIQQEFVVDEVMFTPRSGFDLGVLLQRYNGVVNDHGMVPARVDPPQLSTTPFLALRQNAGNAGFVVVKVDLLTAPLGSFVQNATELGITGTHRFSSLEAVRLFAIVAAERRAQREIGVNAILSGGRATRPCVFTTTYEAPSDPSAPNHLLPNIGYMDGFKLPWLDDPDVQVAEAWRHLADFGWAKETVYLAVIDGGFAPNEDFRPTDLTYDFTKDRHDASGPNPMKCGGGASCPYHGTQVFSVAGAVVNNRFGAAGTGGQVIVPMLLKIDGSVGQAARAVQMAVKWSEGVPTVINMSFWGSCGFWCYEKPFRDAVNDAAAAGIIPIAIAGNDSTTTKVVDPSDNSIAPCKYSGAICVGAIDTSRHRADFSNAGKKVEIWAPGVGLVTTPTPETSDALSDFSGTSAAAPFVAGVVAMMKAVNPFLSRDQILGILQTTASASLDPKVTPGFVNGLRAVLHSGSFKRRSTHFEGTGVLWHDFFAIGTEFPASGDFNGDCRDDIVTFLKGTDGKVFVALSVGSPGHEFVGTGVQWHDGFCFGDEICAVGDFNGDGRDDIASFNQDTGEVKVSLSTGTGFGPASVWHSAFSTRRGQTVVVGNFNFTATPSEVKDDIAVFVRGNDPSTLGPSESRGEVYVALSTGSGFGPRRRWHDFFAPGPEQVAVGDFDGDGRDDIVGFLQDCCPEPDRGDVYVALSIGSSFRPSEKWHDSFSIDTEIPAVGDVDGDGQADVVTFVRDGKVFVGTSIFRDAGLKIGPGVIWHESFCFDGEVCRVGDFDGDGRSDVIAFTRSDEGDVFVATSCP